MSSEIYDIIDTKNFGVRLDVFLSDKTGKTRSQIKNIIESGKALVNGKIVKCGYKLKQGDKLEVNTETAVPLKAQPQNIEIEIVYEDENFAVINKPQGMVVHPAPGWNKDTLVNALLYRLNSLSSVNGDIRPGIVHRLDKDTSGLIVIAKNDRAHANLAKQISEKSASRIYIALCDGVIKDDEFTVDKPLGRSFKDRKKIAVRGDGKKAVTHFKVLNRFKGYTLIECRLETGRTHQIRVHLKSVNHPVTGDSVYGGSNKFSLKGQLLHACRLELNNPENGERMVFTSELPDYFKKVIELLKKEA